MIEEASAAVVELSSDFVAMLRKTEPNWEKGYFRFCHEGSVYGSNASYVSESEAMLIDPFDHGEAFRSMNEKSVKLLELLGKNQGLFLLLIDSQLNFNIKFEFNDLKRWRITKLDGGTGIPEGI